MLKLKKKSIILLHGNFEPDFYKTLKVKENDSVFVMEGRPTLESSRDVCKALLKRKITPTLIADNMAGFLFYKGLVKEVWIAYQLIEKDGVLCEIGALILAVLANKHQVPVRKFLGKHIQHFMGSPRDLVKFMDTPVAVEGVRAYVPLVDWVAEKYFS